MLKAVGILAIGAVVAAFFVPFDGKTLWQRVERRAFPQAVRPVRGTTPRPQKPAASAPVQARRDRTLADKPKEKLSGDDRAALDRLVTRRVR